MPKMLPVMSFTFQLLSGKTDLCCLCHKNVEDEECFSLEEEITLEDCTKVEIFDLLTYVLGVEHPQDALVDKNQSTTNLPTEKLCADCCTLSINCHEFITMCKVNINSVERMVGNINVCCDDAFPESDNFKTVYITIDEETSLKKLYLDHVPAPDNNVKALKRLKMLSRPKKPQTKKLLNNSDDMFDNSEDLMNDEENEKVSKKKKIRVACPVPIEEMLDVEKKIIRCKVCKRIFHTIYRLKMHYLRLHAPKNFPCNQCNNSYALLTLLEKHKVETHTARVKCTVCGKFYGKRSLQKHEKSHQCRDCGKMIDYKKPTIIQWGEGPEKFESNDIKKKYCTECDLKYDYICPHCDTILQSETMYLVHVKDCLKTVDKWRVFCDICGKGYAEKSGLLQHMAVHGFGDYLSCKWCDKKFKCESSVRNHEVKHTRVRNHTCEHCGQTFVTKPALVYHIRLHTGEKPYPCELCDESFVSASRRMEHKRRKHFAPTKECPKCSLKFTNNYTYKKHVRRHYNPKSKLYCPDIDK